MLGAAFDRLDGVLDRIGVGPALDAASEYLLGDRIPSDRARYHARASSIAGYLPYRTYDEENRIFENLHSFGWVLEVWPLTGGDTQTESIIQGVLEEAMPDEVHVQISSYSSPYVGTILEKWAGPRVKRGGVMETIGRQRADYFKDMIWKSGSRSGPYHARDFRVFVSASMPKTNATRAIASLIELRERVQKSFDTLGHPAESLNASGVISLVSGWLNMGRDTCNPEVEYDPQSWVCDQMVRSDSSIEVFKPRLELENTGYGVHSYLKGTLRARQLMQSRNEVRTFSVSRLPHESSQSMMASLLGDWSQDTMRLSGSVWKTLQITYLSREKSQSKAGLSAAKAGRQFSSPVAKFFPAVLEKAREWQAANTEVQDGARLVRFCYQIMVQCPHGAGEEAERNLRNLYRTRGWDLERNDSAHLISMLTQLPMGYGDNFSTDLENMRLLRTGLTRHMPALAPLQGQPKSFGHPHMMLMTRLGQPLFWSQFQNEGEGNHNVAVTGESGSGKSVFMQSLCADGLAAGYHAIVVDDGRSFETMCHLLGGEHVVFRADKAICVNPFSLVSEKALTSHDDRLQALDSIVQVIELMAFGEEGASRDELGVIDEAVGTVWKKKGRKGSVEDVRQILLKMKTPTADLIAQGMSPYGVGRYKEFFNGQASLTTHNPFTVYELSDLESMKELRGVIILCLLFQVDQRMKIGGRGQRKMVFIDEAWQMLGGGPAARFIEGFARRARKEGGSLVTGTQSVNDYYANDGSRAAFENSAWRILLRISEEEAEGLRSSKRLSMDDATLGTIKTLKMSRGEFSEMLITGPGTKLVARLTLDPFTAKAFSSSPADYARIRAGVEAGRDLAEVVAELAMKG